MSRLPYSAKTLIEQVKNVRASAKWYEESDPDGLGVVRTIKFDKRTSAWVYPLLHAIEDERLAELNVTEAGYLHVTFTAGPGADDRRKFPLDQAARLVGEQDPGTEGDDESDSSESEPEVTQTEE